MAEGNICGMDDDDDFDDNFTNGTDNGSSSVDNSEFITINVTNEAGESKEIDHINDKEHHGHHTTHSHQAVGRDSNGTTVGASAVAGGSQSPNATVLLSQPSTSGHSK